jgi:hypothetical protein
MSERLIEPLPCPCGASGWLRVRRDSDRKKSGKECFRVECLYWKCDTPSGPWKRDREGAVEAWNEKRRKGR